MARRRTGTLLVLVVLVLGGLEVFVGPADQRARHEAELTEITIASEAVGDSLPTEVVVPGGADQGDRRPLLLLLYGRGAGGQDSNLNESMYAALADQGELAPIVAFPSGGDHSYWHNRAAGDWADYLTNEVIPRVESDFNVDGDRVAIGGISMGGFGALDLARVHPGRFCAVGAHSPALWQTGAATAPGAFDDAADFAHHDLVGSAEADPTPWRHQSLWMDAGNADPFRPGIEKFVTAVRATAARMSFQIWPGGHEGDYWRSHWSKYMRFYARALRRCRR